MIDSLSGKGAVSVYGLEFDEERPVLLMEDIGGHLLDYFLKERPFSFFESGRKDHPTRFQIPQKLYSRTEKIDVLLRAFERASSGQAELLMVAGTSGVGKTLLIHEIHKTITEKHGYFIDGKFDPKPNLRR